MSPQVELVSAECDDAAVSKRNELQKRLRLLRTDPHTMYGVPSQIWDMVETKT